MAERNKASLGDLGRLYDQMKMIASARPKGLAVDRPTPAPKAAQPKPPSLPVSSAASAPASLPLQDVVEARAPAQPRRPFTGETPRRSKVAHVITDDEAASSAATQILLGIDFGTAFTKVVWRQWSGTRMGVASIGPAGTSMAPWVLNS